MKASSRPSPPSVNYIINNGMNFLRASGSLPTPFSDHWEELLSIKTGTGKAVFLFSMLPCLLPPSSSRQIGLSSPFPCPARFLHNPCLLLNKNGQKQLHDVCTTGVLLGKVEVYFIILQRQDLKYAENCAEAQQDLLPTSSTIPDINQNQAAATQLQQLLQLSRCKELFCDPNSSPTKDVSEVYSEIMPASCKQEGGRSSKARDIGAHSPLNFAQSSHQTASLAPLRDHLLLQEQSLPILFSTACSSNPASPLAL